MESMDNSVVFIIPNGAIIQTIQAALSKLGESHPVFFGSMEQALEIASQCLKLETKVIVSTGLTSKYLQHQLSIPVLEMVFGDVEIINAINEALKVSDKILIIGSGNIRHSTERVLHLFSDTTARIALKEFTADSSLDSQAEAYLREIDCDVVISSDPGVQAARKHGKAGILFNVDERMVAFALSNAKSLVQLELDREEKARTVQAIINHSSEGLLVVDEQNRIQSINNVVKRIVGLGPGEIIGRDFDLFLREQNIADIFGSAEPPDSSSKKMIVDKAPLAIGNDHKGTVVSMRDANEVTEIASRAQKSLRQKGHVARNTFRDIVGSSEAIERVKRRAKIFAKSDSTVLLLGDTGTGKELFAQSIHNESGRKNHAFVAVNCAALPETLLESELFGYVKGAFTGALNVGKQGLFELANKGTIFLDEVSEIPINMQARLLRVLQEREVVRIGDDTVRSVDIRIITASNQNLKELVKAGLFRKDLYYRISVLELLIPPLGARAGDIEQIAYSLVWAKNTALKKDIGTIEKPVLDRMKEMSWPGNIRQLNNFIEKLMILSQGNTIRYEDFKDLMMDEEEDFFLTGEQSGGIETLRDMENRHILRALEYADGNKAVCAKLLGIDPSTLWRKLKAVE